MPQANAPVHPTANGCAPTISQFAQGDSTSSPHCRVAAPAVTTSPATVRPAERTLSISRRATPQATNGNATAPPRLISHGPLNHPVIVGRKICANTSRSTPQSIVGASPPVTRHVLKASIAPAPNANPKNQIGRFFALWSHRRHSVINARRKSTGRKSSTHGVSIAHTPSTMAATAIHRRRPALIA